MATAEHESDPVHSGGRQGYLQGTAFAGLLFSLVLAPWPLGSNRPWAVAVLAAIVWSSLLTYVLSVTIAWPADRTRRFHPGLAVAALGALGFAGLICAQLAAASLSPDGVIGTVDAFHTRTYLLRTLLYLGAAGLVIATVTTPQRVKWLLGAVVAAGLLQAAAAVVLHSSRGTYEYLFMSFTPTSRATGTFPNPDELAAYMELCLSAGFGLLLSQWRTGDKQQVAGWRGSTVRALRFVMSGKMLLRLLLAVMVIALVMTRSRMGNAAFFIALGLAGVTIAVASRQLRRPAIWLVASMAVIDVIVIGQWVGLEHVVRRLDETPVLTPDAEAAFGQGFKPPMEESVEQRLVVPMMSLRLVADRPWFGHGGGTYTTAFPAFKQPGDAGILLYWDHAHNDYVQVACDMGLIGLLCWLAMGVATAWRAVQLVRDDTNRLAQGVGAAASMATLTMGLHSIVDFNLHIVAHALTFCVLLAVVWVLPLPRASSGARSLGSRAAVAPGFAAR